MQFPRKSEKKFQMQYDTDFLFNKRKKSQVNLANIQDKNVLKILVCMKTNFQGPTLGYFLWH